jgi:aryl-alcohol dehydrogenase-like predicted oxidoreductase
MYTTVILNLAHREGKIKYIGLSECSSDTLRRGYAIHPISAVQVEYNPWTLDIESETGTNLLRTCRELGVAVVTYSPLGRGFLTGRYKSLDDFEEKDTRRQLPRFSPENFSKNLDLVNIFEKLAAQKGCTPAQVALAWIMAQGPDFFPIPGTKRIRYLEQNLGAVDVKISPEENKHIRDTIISMGGASGKRTVDTANAFADTPPL